LTSGSGTAVEHAGATEAFVGVAQNDAAAGENVTVRLRGMSGSNIVIAAGAFSAGATLYGAAAGKVDDTAAGQAIGTALTAATGDAEQIECVFDALATSTIGDAMNLHDRYTLVERFQQSPVLNTDIAVSENLDFELLGTNAATANSVGDAGGGVSITTAGADGDGMFILPHLDTNQTSWEATDWLTNKELEWEAMIRTGSAAQIGNAIIWAGLKLTNTDVIATDDDQAFFRYENGVNSGKFQFTSSASGTDDTDDTGVTVAAATNYHLRIAVGADLIPKAYINDVLVATGAALTTGIALIPYICIEADGAAEAKVLYVRWTGLSRKY